MPLPAGYRVVGGLSIAYALVMTAFLVFVAAASEKLPAPAGVLDWLTAAAFILAPVCLLLGGCALFARSPGVLRGASAALVAAAAVLLLKAGVVTAGVVQELRAPTSSTGVLVVFNIPLVIMPASIWAVAVLVTGIALGRRLRGDRRGDAAGSAVPGTAPDRGGA